MEVVSTGGTAQELRKHLPQVVDISELTGFPEILSGRVKTLHPAVHGGILARKGNSQDQETLMEHKLATFDLVVLNLYPFEAEAAKHDNGAELLEFIDIGGVALLRAAAKNYEGVALVTSPDDYSALADEMRQNSGGIGMKFRQERMVRAFELSSSYDACIAKQFGKSLP